MLNTIIYGCCALVISDFFSYNKFLNFAIGSYIMVACYILVFINKFGINIANIIMIFVVLIGFFGINYMILKKFPNDKKKEQVGLIITLGISIFLENLGNYFYGASSVYNHSGDISDTLLVILFIGLFCISFYFHRFSYIGKEFKSINEYGDITRELGIKIDNHIQILSVFLFLIILLLAYLLIHTSSIRMQDGFFYMIKGIGIMMLVGLSKKERLFIGALIYVIIEYLLFVNIGLPLIYKESMILIIIVLCLLYKPEGLFTLKKRSI